MCVLGAGLRGSADAVLQKSESGSHLTRGIRRDPCFAGMLEPYIAAVHRAYCNVSAAFRSTSQCRLRPRPEHVNASAKQSEKGMTVRTASHTSCVCALDKLSCSMHHDHPVIIMHGPTNREHMSMFHSTSPQDMSAAPRIKGPHAHKRSGSNHSAQNRQSVWHTSKSISPYMPRLAQVPRCHPPRASLTDVTPTRSSTTTHQVDRSPNLAQCSRQNVHFKWQHHGKRDAAFTNPDHAAPDTRAAVHPSAAQRSVSPKVPGDPSTLGDTMDAPAGRHPSHSSSVHTPATLPQQAACLLVNEELHGGLRAHAGGVGGEALVQRRKAALAEDAHERPRHRPVRQLLRPRQPLLHARPGDLQRTSCCACCVSLL